MWPNPQETADLITFTEEILNGKLPFLCSVRNEALNKENHVAPFIFSSSLFYSFMTFGKNESLE